MTKTIPMKLLTHTVTLRQITGLDRNRNPVYSEYILKNVRMGGSKGVSIGSTGISRSDEMTLFIDSTNTVCTDLHGEEINRILPKEKDVVIFNGFSYAVKKIQPCYSLGEKPHHWEVSLE